MYIMNYMIFVLGVQLRNICIYIWKTTSFIPLHREHINKKKCPSWTNFIGPNLLLSEMIRPCKCFPRVCNMQILKYNWLNGLTINNDPIWNFIHTL